MFKLTLENLITGHQTAVRTAAASKDQAIMKIKSMDQFTGLQVVKVIKL